MVNNNTGKVSILRSPFWPCLWGALRDILVNCVID